MVVIIVYEHLNADFCVSFIVLILSLLMTIDPKNHRLELNKKYDQNFINLTNVLFYFTD